MKTISLFTQVSDEGKGPMVSILVLWLGITSFQPDLGALYNQTEMSIFT